MRTEEKGKSAHAVGSPRFERGVFTRDEMASLKSVSIPLSQSYHELGTLNQRVAATSLTKTTLLHLTSNPTVIVS